MKKATIPLSPVFILLPTVAQKRDLKETFERFNRACQLVRDVALEKDLLNKIALQKIIYRQLRDELGLPAQLCVRAIGVGVELAKAHVHTFCPHARLRKNRTTARTAAIAPPDPLPPYAPIVADYLIASFRDPFSASIRTLHRREAIPMLFYMNAPRPDVWPFSLIFCDDQPDSPLFWVHLPLRPVAPTPKKK